MTSLQSLHHNLNQYCAMWKNMLLKALCKNKDIRKQKIQLKLKWLELVHFQYFCKQFNDQMYPGITQKSRSYSILSHIPAVLKHRSAARHLQTPRTFIHKRSFPCTAVPRVSGNTRTPCADMFGPYHCPSIHTLQSPRVPLQQTTGFLFLHRIDILTNQHSTETNLHLAPIRFQKRRAVLKAAWKGVDGHFKRA